MGIFSFPSLLNLICISHSIIFYRIFSENKKIVRKQNINNLNGILEIIVLFNSEIR
jgi:hypothetical protein